MPGLVRTVLGDLPADQLGTAYLHEHLVIDSPAVADRQPQIWLPSVAEAVAEVATCTAAGVGAMVDAMPCAAGRHVDRLAEISRRTGLHIVAATGRHTARYYPAHPWIEAATETELAALFRADVVEGIDALDYTGPVLRRTPYRAGIVKVATGGPAPGPAERRAFAAAAEVARATGVPILTHCEQGLGGLAQLELLREFGVPLARVVLSHTDKCRDAGYHRELLGAGVNLEYDQALRQDPAEPRGTAYLLLAMVEAGYGGQLLLGTDGARRSLWRTLGGRPGLAWLAAEFPTVLRARGLPAEALDAIFVHNPARVLALADH